MRTANLIIILSIICNSIYGQATKITPKYQGKPLPKDTDLVILQSQNNKTRSFLLYKDIRNNSVVDFISKHSIDSVFTDKIQQDGKTQNEYLISSNNNKTYFIFALGSDKNRLLYSGGKSKSAQFEELIEGEILMFQYQPKQKQEKIVNYFFNKSHKTPIKKQNEKAKDTIQEVIIQDPIISSLKEDNNLSTQSEPLKNEQEMNNLTSMNPEYLISASILIILLVVLLIWIISNKRKKGEISPMENLMVFILLAVVIFDGFATHYGLSEIMQTPRTNMFLIFLTIFVSMFLVSVKSIFESDKKLKFLSLAIFGACVLIDLYTTGIGISDYLSMTSYSTPNISFYDMTLGQQMLIVLYTPSLTGTLIYLSYHYSPFNDKTE